MSHSRIRPILMATLTAVLLMAAPGWALAQTATPTPVPTPVPAPPGAAASLADTTIEAQLWPEAEQGQSVLIVGVTLPESTPLPAVVRLPVPAGAQVVWAGEIVGGGPENDIQREPTLAEGEAGQVVEFITETARTVQYEAILGPLLIDGSELQSRLDWVQSEDSNDVSFSVRMPPGAANVRIDPDAPGTPQTNEVGETLYTLVPVTIGLGQTFTVTATYEREGLTGQQSSDTDIVPILLAILGVAVVVLVIVVMMQRRGPAVEGSEDADDEDLDDPDDGYDD